MPATASLAFVYQYERSQGNNPGVTPISANLLS